MLRYFEEGNVVRWVLHCYTSVQLIFSFNFIGVHRYA